MRSLDAAVTMAPPAAEALEACVALGALTPQASVELFVAAGTARLSRALAAEGGFFGIASLRVEPEGDPLRGWRLDVYYGFGSFFPAEMQRADEQLRTQAYVHDRGIQRLVQDAGRHRIFHDGDPRTQPDAGALDIQSWELFQLSDRLKLIYALSADVELHFGFDRGPGARPFEAHDVSMLEALTRGLEPWAERVALLHGSAHGRTLLSARERSVLCGLLGQSPLKNVAAELGISEARAREVTRNVYRKLQVDGRLGLAHAWAGIRTETAFAPISAPLLRRRG